MTDTKRAQWIAEAVWPCQCRAPNLASGTERLVPSADSPRHGAGGSVTRESLLVACPPERLQRAVLKRSRLEKWRFAANGALLPQRLKAGHWDTRAIDLEAHPTMALMRGFCEQAFDIESCRPLLAAYYQQRGLDHAAAHDKAAARASDYVATYRDIAADMRANGFRAGVAKDEVGVAVGRTGEWLKASGGQHRFALARALGLERIVVDVQFVHLRWFRRYGRVYRDDPADVIRRVLAAEPPQH